MKFLNVPQSGSIAASTHSHNRAGQYTRNRRAPVQPIGSGRRGFIRATFGAASQAWSGLTDAQRASWDSFAQDHPVTDSLGQSIVLTGHQTFVRVYVSAINVQLAAPTVPPADTITPNVSGSVLTAGIVGGLSVDGFTGDTADKVAVAFSRPMSQGRSFNKTFWQPNDGGGVYDADSAPGLVTTAIYAAEFGTPVVGQRIFARVTPVNEFGWNGTPIIISDIVGA